MCFRDQFDRTPCWMRMGLAVVLGTGVLASLGCIAAPGLMLGPGNSVGDWVKNAVRGSGVERVADGQSGLGRRRF